MEGALSLRRPAYLLLVLLVVAGSIATYLARPRGGAPAGSCVPALTLAIEVCPRADVEAILAAVAEGGPQRDDGRRLRLQTIADLALVAAYTALWSATGMALAPAAGLVAAAAGAADVVEDLGILHELSLGSPIALVRWAALAKWVLLGMLFLALAVLFRPCRAAPAWRPLLRAATGVAYAAAGVCALAGAAHPPLLAWAGPVIGVAVVLQGVLHWRAHDEFEAARGWWRGAAVPAPCLSLEHVLREEYAAVHPSAGPAPAGGLVALYEAIHALPEKRAALCLSGGGIRSATFALGVMQGLSRALPRFHYLSTVSGGGYIGAWLTAWIDRAGNDVDHVAGELRRLSSPDRLAPEPSPISELRDYTNYLAPSRGLMSADTWTLLGTLVRNLLLVWAVLIPLIAAALTVPRFYLALVRNRPEAAWGDPARWLLLGLGAVALAFAITYIGASIPSSTTSRRGQGAFLTMALAPVMLSVLCLTLYWAWWPTTSAWAFVRFAVAVHSLAWLGYTTWLWTRWSEHRRWARDRSIPRRLGASLLELPVVVAVGAAGGGIAWFVAKQFLDDGGALGSFTLLYAVLAPAMFLNAFLLAATLLVGFLSRLTDDDDREWWARCGAWMLIAALAWLVLSALVLFGPAIFSGALIGSAVAAAGGLSGLIALAGGWSARTSAGGTEPGSVQASLLGRLGLPGAAIVFAAVLLMALSLLTSGLVGLAMDHIQDLVLIDTVPEQWPSVDGAPWDHAGVLLISSPLVVFLLGAGLAALGGGVAWLVNTNKFSLHAMYRARLIRAYLGASNMDRRANAFTGFDPADDIQMHELWPNVRPPSMRREEPRALFHVVNIALNLVHGDRLAWQERKAHSFTVTPLHAGSVAVGGAGAYRRTAWTAHAPHGHYGGPRGMSLGTAVTISGAAASPNMGYHSSPVVTFLMTFFNARLGGWLGNPGAPGDRTYWLSSPRMTVRPIVAEALGLTGRTAPYVYLSDGGHFDNLGLYEMVLRRCHFVVISDAGCDERCGLNDLGGAIRKIRADLGIRIEFPRGIAIYSRTADAAIRARGVYWAVGRIRYSAVDPPPTPDPAAADARDGWILYIKPAFYGTEPPDVFEYATANPRFPHESTVDQFFSESQFESYRMLGLHAAERLTEGLTGGGTLGELFRHADRPQGPQYVEP